MEMTTDLSDHLSNLKAVLTDLDATGQEGFEGLIGTALSEIAGVPFRLARSGSQFGVDGKSAHDSAGISFECKRYAGQVRTPDIMSKIGELSIGETDIDLWVLCATSSLSSQIADNVSKFSERSSISTVILDWTDNGLPPLAVALAMASEKVGDFLRKCGVPVESTVKAMAALGTVQNDPAFERQADRIRETLRDPTLGMDVARQANAEWLTETFSNRQLARQRLGQPLSPSAPEGGKAHDRGDLVSELLPFLTGSPREEVLWIVGGWGNGKSWLCAQAWLSIERKPLAVILTPNRFAAETAERTDARELLISALIEQTGEHAGSTDRDKWGKTLGRWRDAPADRIRLVVVIDGTNQRPEKDWARIGETFGAALKRMSGQLVMTARTQYYRDRIQRRLGCRVRELEVPEWTERECDEILAAHGIASANLHPGVATSLRNPRLLGIALELLSGPDIEGLDEISVSRLLFEHIRASERDAPTPQPAHEFARRLRKHAEEVIKRSRDTPTDDPAVFDCDDLQGVADGRFFQVVEGDPTRYRLHEDGLTLALGFAVVDRLRRDHRNGRDLDESLAEVIEPVAAVDDTVSVVLAAITVTCNQSSDPPDFAVALIRGFADLQNPDESKFPQFTSLARAHPAPFTEAARRLCLSSGRQPNFDWIRGALILATEKESAWNTIFADVQAWLSCYTRVTEGNWPPVSSHSSTEQREEKRRERERNLSEKLHALSPAEQDVLDAMSEADGDINMLSRLAFVLLAGKPIAPAARALKQWSFSHALNSDYAAPYREFMHLVRLNRADWRETRIALLQEMDVFRQEDTSRTGKWALVTLLRSTGDPEDAEQARILTEDLTSDRDRPYSWRLVENYCATDPCDPTSERPDNISQTAQNYRSIDVSKIRLSRNASAEDHFLSMARPGIVRFEARTAADKHKELARHVVTRKDSARQYGLFELRDHNALLAKEIGLALLESRQGEGDRDDDLSGSERWRVHQFSLLIAFPFMSDSEQMQALLSLAPEDEVLCDLMDVAKPPTEAVFDRHLETACRGGDQRAQFLLLAFANATSAQVSTDSIKRIAHLATVGSERVQAEAFEVIARLGDTDRLAEVVRSNWRAVDGSQPHANWYGNWNGSDILAQAVVRGLIEHEDALDRMAPGYYGQAVEAWGREGDPKAVRSIALRVDAALRRITRMEGSLTAPDIEMHVEYKDSSKILYSIADTPADLHETLERISETDSEHEQRQRRHRDAFQAFRDRLTEQKCHIILDHFGLDAFRTMMELNPDIADRWYALFMRLPETRLPAAHNFALLLAHALAGRCPARAAELFRRAGDGRPMVRVTFGYPQVPLDAMSIWGGSDRGGLDGLRFRRLDGAENDHVISQEVLAAHLNGRQGLLRHYVRERLERREPAEVAHALMVAGFSDQDPFNDNVLDRYRGTDGFIGDAHEAARYAYDRNTWARHWFERMCHARGGLEFWRFSVLFTKIVDGRHDLWQSEYEIRSEPMRLFWPSIGNKLQNRIRKWDDQRKKKLFGQEVPAEIFLRPWRSEQSRTAQ